MNNSLILIKRVKFYEGLRKLVFFGICFVLGVVLFWQIFHSSFLYWCFGIFSVDFKRQSVCFSKAIDLDNEYVYAYSARAWSYFHLNDFKNALKDFQKVQKLAPEQFSGWYGYGVVRRFQKDYPDALKFLSQSIAVCPFVPWGYKARSEILKEMGEYKYFMVDQIKYYNLLNNYSVAFSYADKLISFDPHAHEGYEARAELFLRKKKFVDAADDFEKVIQLQPDLLWIYIRFALLKKRLGDSLAAISILDQVLEKKSDFADAYFEKASVLEGLKNYEGAMQNYYQAGLIFFQRGFLKEYNKSLKKMNSINIDSPLTVKLKKIAK